MYKLLASQNSQKSMDKDALLRGLKTLLINHRQQNKSQVPSSLQYGSISTPEPLGQKDMNESKKISESNQDQNKSINQLST